MHLQCKFLRQSRLMRRSWRLGRITSPVFEVEKEIPAASGDPMEQGQAARAAAVSLPLSRAVYALAIAAISLHVAFSGRFGFFRDELYYAACGQRLAWGYVDHAPLAPFLARLSRALLGDSLSALRLLPALAASAKVLLGAWMARELGGGKYAQFLAAFCVLLAPIYLAFDKFKMAGQRWRCFTR